MAAKNKLFNRTALKFIYSALFLLISSMLFLGYAVIKVSEQPAESLVTHCDSRDATC